MTDVHLGLAWDGPQREGAHAAFSDLVSRVVGDEASWSLIYGRDPDREEQVNASGIGAATCLTALVDAARGYGPALEATTVLPILGNQDVTMQVFDHPPPIDLVFRIPEEAFSDATRDAQATAELVILGATLLEKHGAALGYLGREAGVNDIVDDSDVRGVTLEGLSRVEFTFWRRERFALPSERGELFRVGDVIVWSQAMSLCPYEHPYVSPPGLERLG